jgi:hypothetical protein
MTTRFMKIALLGLGAPLIFGAGPAHAQGGCNAALPAFLNAMKSGSREVLQAYLDAHAPCYADQAQARLAALGDAPDAAPPEGAGNATPEYAAPDPAVDETCTRHANARSERSDQPVPLRVVNRGSVTLSVNWIDYEGERRHAGTVEPGGVFGGGTYVTHPFEFVGPDGNCVHILQPQVGVAEYTVGE